MNQIWPFALLGLSAGAAYALTAVGVITIYRGSGVLNFAFGAMGMVGAYVFWELYNNSGTPLVPSMVVGVLAGAVLGVVVHALVIRPLSREPVLTQVIATLGVLQILQGIADLHYGTDVQPVDNFLGTSSVEIFHAHVSVSTLIQCAIAIVLTAALWLLFARTRLGLFATALRERPDAAAVVGLSPHPVGLITWGLGSALAAFAGILLLPVTQLSPEQLTIVVMPALAVALAASFTNFWIGLGAGLGLGVLESVLVGQGVASTWTASIPFLIVVVALVARGRSSIGRGEGVTEVPAVGSGRGSVPTVAGGFVLAIVFGMLLSSSWSTATTATLVTAILALSVVVVTGWTGQLSLAPMALAGLSSLFVAQTSANLGFPTIPAALCGVVGAVLCGLVVGAPATRVRGVNLAIVTLGLALVVENSIFADSSLTGGILGLNVDPASILGFHVDPMDHPARYAGLCLVIFACCVGGLSNLRRSGSGRQLLAIRSNERSAASLGISVAQGKLAGFAISAGLAGLAGVLITFQQSTQTVSGMFPAFASITLLGFVILGGVGYIWGAVLAGTAAAGGVFSHLLSGATGIDKYLPVASGFFILLVLLQNPDGSVPLMRQQAQAVLDALRRVRGKQRVAAPVVAPSLDVVAAASRQVHEAGVAPAGPVGRTVLEVTGVSVRFGATVAVDDVTLALRSGEVLGLIGPNGAGKTTLIDALTGFERVSAGRVTLNGRDITAVRPHGRARMGIRRTWQTLELFEGLTLGENVLCAIDQRRPWRWATDLVAPRRQQSKNELDGALRAFGLEAFEDLDVEDLPHGVRQVVSLARAAAQRPEVLCLDEPMAGLTHSEKRMVGGLIRDIAARTGAAIVLIEHDLDVVTEISDQVVVLEFGRVIARGAAAEVMADDQVKRAYVGHTPMAEVS